MPEQRSGDRLKPRLGLFYGDCFSQVCRLAQLPNKSIAASGIISAATLSKLRHRYRGDPIERATAERLLSYLEDNITGEKRELIEKRGHSIQECLLPANFRLSQDARVALGGMPPIHVSKKLREDCFYDNHVRLLRNGAHGVKRHVVAIAKMILDHHVEQNRPIRHASDVEDLIELETIDEACYPACYRMSGKMHSGRIHQGQLVLIQSRGK